MSAAVPVWMAMENVAAEVASTLPLEDPVGTRDAFELAARLRRAVACEQRLGAELSGLRLAVAEGARHHRWATGASPTRRWSPNVPATR